MSIENDKWLKTALGQESANASDGCLDPEVLAAWTEGRLQGQSLALAEAHVSSCARCLAVLAALERTTPVAQGFSPAENRARLWRWLVPLTAAATAVAIWVVVPERSPERLQDIAVVAPVSPPPASERADQNQDLAVQNRESRTESGEPRAPNPEPRTRNPNPEPGTRNVEPAASADQFAAVLPVEQAPAAALETPPAAKAPAQGAVGGTGAGYGTGVGAGTGIAGGVSTGTLNESLTLSARTAAFDAAAMESLSPANSLQRWRVVAGTSVERSTDGGKTWVPTAVPAGVSATSRPPVTIARVRAIDANRAVLATSTGQQVYTTDAGRTWTVVQENQAAPF